MELLLKLFFMSILIISSFTIYTNATKLSKGKDSKILRIVSLHHNNHNNNNNNYFTPKKDENSYLEENDTPSKYKLSGKKSHFNNKQLLSKLGLSKIRVPASHSRKRLAVESRHHARPDDSHMFIIKLPPNPYYYSNQIPVDFKNSIVDDYGKSKVSLGFRSNGKPGKIYHWNIPALKKIVTGDNDRTLLSRQHSNNILNDDISKIIDIKNIPTWSKPWENETIEKSYRKGIQAENKSLKKKSPTYYAPIKQIKQHNNKNFNNINHNNNNNNNFHKYFPGNGKPKGFYVIEKKSHKPAYYKELIP